MIIIVIFAFLFLCFVPIGVRVIYDDKLSDIDIFLFKKLKRTFDLDKFLRSIIVDKENVIVTGHTRLKAAQKLGLKEVPVIRAEDLSDEQIKAFRLADNKVGEYAQWDEDLLGLELSDIDLDMSEFGFIDEINEKFSKNFK